MRFLEQREKDKLFGLHVQDKKGDTLTQMLDKPRKTWKK